MLVHGVKGGVWDRSCRAHTVLDSIPSTASIIPKMRMMRGSGGTIPLGGGGTWPRDWYIYIYISVYVNITYIHFWTTDMHACIVVCMYRTHIYACMHSCFIYRTHIYLSPSVFLYIYIYICISIYLYMYAHVCISNLRWGTTLVEIDLGIFCRRRELLRLAWAPVPAPALAAGCVCRTALGRDDQNATSQVWFLGSCAPEV